MLNFYGPIHQIGCEMCKGFHLHITATLMSLARKNYRRLPQERRQNIVYYYCKNNYLKKIYF